MCQPTRVAKCNIYTRSRTDVSCPAVEHAVSEGAVLGNLVVGDEGYFQGFSLTVVARSHQTPAARALAWTFLSSRSATRLGSQRIFRFWFPRRSQVRSRILLLSRSGNRRGLACTISGPRRRGHADREADCPEGGW